MLRRSLLTSAIAASLLTTFSLPAFATQVYETDLVIIGGRPVRFGSSSERS